MRKYLPVGTIVNLEKTEFNWLIIGIGVTNESDGKDYEYAATMLPFGLIKEASIIYFNEDGIEKIIQKGIEDKDYDFYMEEMNKILTKEQLKPKVTDKTIGEKLTLIK